MLPSPTTLFPGLEDVISLNNDAGNCNFDLSDLCGVELVFCRVGGPSRPGVVDGRWAWP
jgi:hypothetical protein